jgi:hypothetical protein
MRTRSFAAKIRRSRISRDVAQCGVLFVFGRCLEGGIFSFRGKNSGQEFVCRIVVQAGCPHQLGVASRALQYPQSEPPPFAYTHEPHCPSAYVASRKTHNRHFAGRPVGSVRCCKIGALDRANMRALPMFRYSRNAMMSHTSGVPCQSGSLFPATTRSWPSATPLRVPGSMRLR